MKRILITGMSGTGKSTVVRELQARGYRAVDTDYDGWSRWVDMRTNQPAPPPAAGEDRWDELDWAWDEERMLDLLTNAESDVLFVAGTSPNQRAFYPHFDLIILLSAPVSVLTKRLTERTNNPYGTTPRSLHRVLEHVATVEPLLRKRADYEIDTDAPLDEVVERVLQLIHNS